jgi:hypothetical protein
MPSYDGSRGNPYWFDPVALLLEAVGPDDPRYLWWASVVGRSLGAQLTNMNSLCSLPPLQYPEMTQENIDALGLPEIFRLWMIEYLYSICTIP